MPSLLRSRLTTPRLARLVGASLVLSALFAVPPAAASAKQACDLPSPSGTRTIPLSAHGQDRSFLLHVPPGYDGRHRLALVMNLHGYGLSGEAQMAISRMAALADRKGFAVAAPDGSIRIGPGRFAWHVPGGGSAPPGTPNDERYLLSVIRTVGRTVCTNARRIFFTGYSGGARMSSQMACDFSDRIAAIAPVVGLRAGFAAKRGSRWVPRRSTCKPERPVPVLAFHGTADTVAPYPGDDDPFWGYGVRTALARWATIDHCARRPATRRIADTVDLIRYPRCRGGAEVALYRAKGAGHFWPGSGAGGPLNQRIDATKRMWTFFERHPLRR
jgi:polyhydroxybutyrate depolymerase